jgi:SAM-dependent methyltransferase
MGVFDVSAEAYTRFMGRFSEPLAHEFASFLGVRLGQRALDVGCGPGALTSTLVPLLGESSVAAVDPSASFIEAIRRQYPGVDSRLAPAEDLPFADASFDLALAQLVIHFMADPVAGLSEMVRVTRPGGQVAANVWDCGGSTGPLEPFWNCARHLCGDVDDESNLAGVSEGALEILFERAGLRVAQSTALSVEVRHDSFEEWWEPFTLGVGPAGHFVSELAPEDQLELRERCLSSMGMGPFITRARAWTVSATV